MTRSEIRDSQRNALLEKVQAMSYGQYLRRVVLRRVRGFSDVPVSFDFPVTALIGPNGGGKTTILGAAACAYKAISPRQFFAKSGIFDPTMQNWSIEYEIVDRTVSKADLIRRTANFLNFRWRRDALERPVLVFLVSRTVPANERAELLRCASASFSVPDANIEIFSAPVAAAVGKILGRDVSRFRTARVDDEGRVVLLAGETSSGTPYSEFHFGAGESSIIRMVTQIEAAPDHTLVLIEEIENGLHPVATVRMVDYLIEVAERKRIQAIFTTHSNEALVPLPSQAIWVATQDHVIQGKLDIESLRAIRGYVESQLVIFVEDNFAKVWMEAMIRTYNPACLEIVEIHAMQGDGAAVHANRYHNTDPSAPRPSICCIDGDSRQAESEAEAVYRLPGATPESYVFDRLIEQFSIVGERLTVALLQPFEMQGRVLEKLREIRGTNRDPHLLYAQVGEALGLIPEVTVKAAFATMWAQANPEEVFRVLEPIARKSGTGARGAT